MKTVLTILLTLLVIGLGSADAVAQSKAETQKIKVYLSNIKKDPEVLECSLKFPVERIIAKTEKPYRTALEELFKGATKAEEKEGFYTLPAKDTEGILKSVKVKDGAAYVDFTDRVFMQMGTATTSCGGGYWNAVDLTLKQFPEIKKVYYSIEGNFEDFYGWVQTECPEGLKGCDNEKL